MTIMNYIAMGENWGVKFTVIFMCIDMFVGVLPDVVRIPMWMVCVVEDLHDVSL